MTEDMNDIARKTKVETVSMKVITLVTLFFLPGTFISVGRFFLSVSIVLYMPGTVESFSKYRTPQSSTSIKVFQKLTMC